MAVETEVHGWRRTSHIAVPSGRTGRWHLMGSGQMRRDGIRRETSGTELRWRDVTR